MGLCDSAINKAIHSEILANESNNTGNTNIEIDIQNEDRNNGFMSKLINTFVGEMKT